MYDSIIFAPTRRSYPTYKREPYVIVEFVRKYDYLCKHPHKTTVIHKDHKPLTYLLGSEDGLLLTALMCREKATTWSAATIIYL